MQPKTKAYVYALLAVFAWSTVAAIFKITLRYLSVVELLFYSSAVSSLSLFLILWTQKKVDTLKTFKPNDYLFSVFLGFINPFFYYLILFKAYSILPAQQAQPLNMVWGILMVLMAIPILKQKVRLLDFLVLLICFAGVIVISTEGNLSQMRVTHPLGIGLALASSAIWAFYWILNVKDDKDPILRLFLNFAAGTLFILPFFLSQWRIPPVAGILGAIYVGLFEMGVTFFFWITALKLTERTVNVAILVYLVPFLSFMFIHIVLGERILVSSVVGAALIILGTVIHKYKELRAPKRGDSLEEGAEPLEV
ncbi:MAG: DMT family transporter [Candidatus Omnitrophota bacterium]